QQKSNDKALKTAATREQAAFWTAKALGLEPVKGEKTMELYGYKDWRTITTASVPYVEAVHRNGILKGETTTNYNPKGKIKRGDLASMLSKATDKSLEALGLTTGYGKVTSKVANKDVNPFDQKATTVTDIVVQTPDGAILNMKATNSQSIPVIKGGKVGNESLIQNNDIVEYTLTKENQVLLLQVGRLKELKGKFLSYSPELGTVQMADQNGKRYQFKLLPNTVTTAQKVPININNAKGDTPATAIYEGNTIRALDLDVSADKVNNQEMAVKILFADPLGRVLKVEDEDQNRQYLQLADDADVYINDELQGIEAIGFDQDAVLRVADNRVVEVKVFTDILSEEEPYTQILTGRVREVVGNNLFISPDGASDTKASYIIGNNIPIIKDKQSVNKNKLQPGDRVKIYVDSSMGDYVSRVEVQSNGGVKIANLYKGEIKDVMPATGEIILSNVYNYGFYDWVKQGDYIKYKLSDDAELYNGNTMINMDNLQDYIGKTIYAASKNNYGSEEIVQGLLREGYEDSTYKKINDVKFSASQLTLADGRVLDYVKGSIIIKDGKLMDPSDLKKDAAAFIIQNKGTTSGRIASVISMDSFTGLGGYTLSKGYLNTVGEDYFNMESIFKMANNSWEAQPNSTYQLNDDTYIYDNLVTHGVITADRFAESRFKPYIYSWPNFQHANYGKEFHENDEYHSNYEKNKYTYYMHEHSFLYTVSDENGNAIGINIYTKNKEQFKPDKTHTERITSGQVQSIDSGNAMITISKAMEFSPLYQEWKPSTASIPLDTTKAVVLKDGKPIDLDELTTDDRVYAVSEGNSAVMIIVE
ncbi:MAG: S-layer protein, partial [Clostridia bacterium]|nr:S-layer protein [Clostridia bacterium]